MSTVKSSTGNTTDKVQENITKNIADVSRNFYIPNWDYKGYAQEIEYFRKGLDGVATEPGWFYFKIIFHFDETFGLLGNIVANTIPDDKSGNNTAIQYLRKRQDKFIYDNLKARAFALEKFVKYLSHINSSTPWFFDKISGLNEINPSINDFSKEKKIDISCLPDSVDMRLTSLMHLYQYACFDEINMKEIIPENLRKFNMSIILYHMPIRRFSNTLHISFNETINPKSLYDNGNFSNRMSYKLFTFKGCEIDISSIGNMVPSSLDNAAPFNLAQNNISIRYDRVFTHLMNEWEQFMVGADGFYYDRKNKIGIDEAEIYTDKFYKRISALINSSDINDVRLLDGLLVKPTTTFAKEGHLIGNIYNLDTTKFKLNSLIERNAPQIYMSNIYNVNIKYYKTLALLENIPKASTITIGGKTEEGKGLSDLKPNGKTLADIFNTGVSDRIYKSSVSAFRSNYISVFDLLVNKSYDNYRIYTTKFYISPLHASVADIVTTYKNAWKYLQGSFISIKNAVKNIGKNITQSWGF